MSEDVSSMYKSIRDRTVEAYINELLDEIEANFLDGKHFAITIRGIPKNAFAEEAIKSDRLKGFIFEWLDNGDLKVSM